MTDRAPGRVSSLFEWLGVEPPRTFFKGMNRFTMLGWRLGLGGLMNAWPEQGGRMMVLGTRGRKSGLLRRTPLNYAPLPDGIACVAGFGEQTDWYRNCLADPRVQVWLPSGPWEGTASQVTLPAERLRLLRQVLIASGAAARLFGGLDPHLISDADLERETVSYCVVHVTLERRLSTRVADLAWIWPVAGGLLLLGALLRGR